jgi:DnaJ family protein A protein 2
MTLYNALELQKGASPGEIRKQYLTLSRIYHPDKAPAEKKEEYEHKFKEISRAYEILSDDEKRAFYDQTGQVPGEGGVPDNAGGPGGMPFPFGMGGSMPFDMGDLFGMFGGRGGMKQRGGRQPGKAPPRKTQVPLSLKDFYYGRTLEMHLSCQRFCGECKGEGTINTKACGDCNGQGMRRQIVQMGPMVMENVGPCGACRGSGKSRGDACKGCSGSKFIKHDKVLNLVVSRGMKPGDIITFPGESSNVEDYAEAGDVLVELVAADEDHNILREGNTLKDFITISLGQSLCGTRVKLEGHPAHPSGLVVELPAGVQNKETLVLIGQGMPTDASAQRYGDFHLTILVKPSAAELEVLRSNTPYFKGLFSGPEETFEGLPVVKPGRVMA